MHPARREGRLGQCEEATGRVQLHDQPAGVNMCGVWGAVGMWAVQGAAEGVLLHDLQVWMCGSRSLIGASGSRRLSLSVQRGGEGNTPT